MLELVGVNLRTSDHSGFSTPLISNAHLKIAAAEIVGLVGRSGTGKTTLARAIAGILPADVTRSGEIRVAVRPTSRSHCPVAYIDQDPGATLNPVRRVGGQIVEVVRRNRTSDKAAARAIALDLFRRLSLSDVLFDAYPHQLSGGQQQRAAIARAIACDPALLIADEPGSALDVVTQLELIEALAGWRRELGCAMLLISHEPALIHSLCDRVVRLEHGTLEGERPVVIDAEQYA